eukprot:TRINITY_DN8606_c0_g1_i2.p1 TRINITY_DN8606_c0_g1~~TRINITY_DN8606_c0_g1_i2.p1  ORF type:complete len:401 (-),score=42.48 TRINITY_DN8606_c0_g1_i2:161-1363(-)
MAATDALLELGSVGLDVVFQAGFLEVTFDPMWMMLSFFVSMLGAWRFKEFVHHANDMALHDCVFAACIYGACSVWSLHFIAMNSIQLSSGVVLKYNVFIVLASLLATLPGAMSAYYFLVKLRTGQTMHHCVEKMNKAFSNYCPSNMNSRRTFCVVMAGLSMVACIATMHYMGHFSMVGIRQVHNIYALIAIVSTCIGLNMSALWLLSYKVQKASINHDIASCIVVTLAVAVPHYISALSVRYYADDAGYVATWTDLEGGPCSNIQKLVLAINFAMGTVVFSMAFNFRERRYREWEIGSAELPSILKQKHLKDEKERKLIGRSLPIESFDVDLDLHDVNINWDNGASSEVCGSESAALEDVTPESSLVVGTTCQITDESPDDDHDASRVIRPTSVPPWSNQ